MKSLTAFLLCLLLANPLPAQPSVQEPRATLHLADVPLAEALQRVEKAYGVSFSYFEQLPAGKITRLRLRDAPLREALAQLLAGTGLTPEVSGRQVILKAGPPLPPAYLTLHGSVQDRETGEVLPHAAVAARGKPLGTVANAAGEFELHLPQSLAADSVRVSMIGYAPFTAAVADLLRTVPVRITLSPQTYSLGEVVVTDSVPDLRTLMKLVEKNIPNNYISEPYLAQGFYREIRQKDYVAQSMVEAAVNIYDQGYDRYHSKEKVVLDQIRTSYQIQRPYDDGWNEINLLRMFLHFNLVRHRSNLFDKKVRYSLAGTTAYNGRPVYVITVHEPSWPITAYVDQESYAVVRLEKRPLPPEMNPAWRVPGTDSVSTRSLYRSFVAEFREHNGKYYLSHQKIEDNLQYFNHHTGQKKEVYTLQLELLITSIRTGATEPAGPAMKPYSLGWQPQPYNPAFWEHYNVLKETPLEEKIRRDLNQQQPLEEQFVQTGRAEKKYSLKKPRK